MGSHTGQLTNAIKIGISTLKVKLARRDEAIAATEAAKQARDAAWAAIQAYYKKKGWGQNVERREEAMEEDQHFQALNATWDAEMTKVATGQKALSKALDECRAARVDAKAKLNGLKDYIKKKEAEKSWWQKTSVTAAKTFIAYADGII
jgi:hypothetical protein